MRACAVWATVARYYDPTTDQFLTRDPLEDLTGQPYSYAADDPIDESDPSGLSPWSWAVQHLDPLYPVIGFYANEVDAYESGCSYLDSVEYGLAGTGVAVGETIGGWGIGKAVGWAAGPVSEWVGSRIGVGLGEDIGAAGPGVGDLRFARAVRLSADSPAVANRSLSVSDYISRFRNASVRGQLPGEFLNQSVEQALRSGNSTVRKLLISGEYAKK